MILRLVNPFTYSDNVYIKIIDEQPIKLNKYYTTDITISKKGLIIFRYIVDNQETYCKNKLFFLAENGLFYNYLISNYTDTDLYINKYTNTNINIYLFTDIIINQSLIIKDNDILYYWYNTYDSNNLYIAAENGHIVAMYKYALYCRSLQDYDKMKRYYLMAIANGCMESMCSLGYYYMQIEKDPHTASIYYKMAAKLGHSKGIALLAEYNHRITRNYNKAIKLYMLAIEKDNVYAMYNLARYYHFIEQNPLALYYYKMAYKKYHKEAAIGIGLYYLYIENNEILGNHYLQNAIIHGYCEAYACLGDYYKDKNYNKTVENYKSAIHLGFNSIRQTLQNYRNDHKKINREKKIYKHKLRINN